MTTIGELKPGDRVTIYGDVEAEVLDLTDRTYDGDDRQWVSLRYRTITTGLVGNFVWPASTRLPLPVRSAWPR